MDLYTILEIKKRQERLGVHGIMPPVDKRQKRLAYQRLGVCGIMPPVDKSHYFFLHLGLVLRELQYSVTVASDFNILKVPLSPSVNLQSSPSFGAHTLIRKSFVVVLSFLFFSSESGSVV